MDIALVDVDASRLRTGFPPARDGTSPCLPLILLPCCPTNRSSAGPSARIPCFAPTPGPVLSTGGCSLQPAAVWCRVIPAGVGQATSQVAGPSSGARHLWFVTRITFWFITPCWEKVKQERICLTRSAVTTPAGACVQATRCCRRAGCRSRPRSLLQGLDPLWRAANVADRRWAHATRRCGRAGCRSKLARTAVAGAERRDGSRCASLHHGLVLWRAPGGSCRVMLPIRPVAAPGPGAPAASCGSGA